MFVLHIVYGRQIYLFFNVLENDVSNNFHSITLYLLVIIFNLKKFDSNYFAETNILLIIII